ncbi:hypothetical protein N9230_02275 [Akkermansiaceae bacterium]|nr:hypothetical protein [Akkermansiaceae bacterium]
MPFIPPPLTRERLSILLRALERRGGEMKARDLTRLNGVDWWEIDQAEEEGFVTTEKRKPKSGRPSKWVKLANTPSYSPAFMASENSSNVGKVSKNHPTKLLPSRRTLERRINRREWDFAFWYVIGEFGPGTGLFGFKRRAWFAYMKAYPSCHSKAAARSSSSRLLKRPGVKAAIAWQFAKIDRLPEINRFHPRTPTEVWDTLHRLGSYRARWAPRDIQRRWVIASLQAKEKPHGLD